jgi:V/A-type H+/Na+-transporting ATPase subunit I
MAIVKMSEFELLVMNTNLDQVLKQLQVFKEISFASTKDLGVEGFAPVVSHYDFNSNERKQEHIQSVLKTLAEIQKKRGKKKSLLADLGIKNMTYDELEQGVMDSDLDLILDTYAEFYERPHGPEGGFKFYVPWEQESLDQETLARLQGQTPIIGTLDAKYVESFIKELNAIEPIYYMYKHDYNDPEAVIVIMAPKEYQSTVAILGEKFELIQRSAVSLHIESTVKLLDDILSHTIEKRTNIHDRIAKIGHFQDALQMHYEYLRNEHVRETARLKFMQSKHVTYIRGWIPSSRVDEFKLELEDASGGIFDLEIDAAALHSKEVPIKLENKGFNQAFENITNMFSQPRYDELDPTPLFAPFYAVFFGMMLGDFGYGLVMGILAFAALKLINFKPGMEAMIKMLGYVSIPTMAWGLVYGSFFGGVVAMKPLIDINNQFMLVLVMSLGFGIFHLFTGLAIKGYLLIRDSKKRYVLYDVIFWYMTLGGVIVLVSQMFSDVLAPFSQVATIVMIIGMIGIVLTNGRDSKTVVGKAGSGLYALYGLANYIGDVVSYSRLMALGLAGASIGVAFNMMVELVANMGVVGTIFGALIFIGGHTFNLLISGLSAYVHSARLTYVEFFGKFFTGGGSAFENFRATPTYINID